jgi:predicted DNA-binding transcriptional regulator AlpA
MPDQTPGPDHTAELLTIAEAALLLRAPVATLRYWRHLGTGPHSFRLGRRVLYRRDDLRAWIDSRRDQSMAERDPAPEAQIDVGVGPRTLVPGPRPRKAGRASTRTEASYRRATKPEG